MEQSNIYETLEDVEKYLPRILIGTLLIIFTGAVIALNDAGLILGLIGILAITAGIIWLDLKIRPLDRD